MTFPFETSSQLTCKSTFWTLGGTLCEIIIQILICFNWSKHVNMQAGVSNQVGRVLGIYERKRTGILYEIDEKPELPNKLIANFQRIFINCQTNMIICWNTNKVTCRTKLSLKGDLPYKIVTNLADFPSEKARTSTRTTKSVVDLYFLLTSRFQNPYAYTNNFYIVKAKTWATLKSFGPFFFDLASVRWSSFQVWSLECAYISRICGVILGDVWNVKLLIAAK